MPWIAPIRFARVRLALACMGSPPARGRARPGPATYEMCAGAYAPRMARPLPYLAFALAACSSGGRRPATTHDATTARAADAPAPVAEKPSVTPLPLPDGAGGIGF